MNKSVFIAERKPSGQPREFVEALKVKTTRHDGYLESENTIVTAVVGHLKRWVHQVPNDLSGVIKRWDSETHFSARGVQV